MSPKLKGILFPKHRYPEFLSRGVAEKIIEPLKMFSFIIMTLNRFGEVGCMWKRPKPSESSFKVCYTMVQIK